MYYPQNNAQWQQPPPPGAPQPPPGGLPHAAQAAPMSAEAAEAFRNYGYGSVPQRGGAGGQANRPGAHSKGRNAHQPIGNHQYGRGGQPGQHNPHAPMSANLPYSPTQAASPAGQMTPGMPYAGGNAPPAKRARYDSNAASSPGLPPHPGYPASLPPNPTHAGNVAQQHYQPMAHQQQQHYQPPLPQGPPLPGPAGPISVPAQQQYYQPPQQQQQPQMQQYQQPMAGYQPVQAGFQYQPQLHQPMSQPQHQPYPSQVRHANNAQPGPPLAVAPMKATPMAAVNRHKNKPSGSSHHHQPPPPPPPASAVPPPPPPPPAEAPVAGPSRPSGTIRLSPKGAASLPPIPTGAATLPPNPTTAAAAASSSLPAASTGPAIPTGPRGAGFKRDTRPLPSQSRQAESSLRGDGPSGSKHAGSAFRGKPPTGPAARGRGRGSSGRSAFDGGRSSGSRPASRRDERFEQPPSTKGYKRTFSQTGPPPTGPRGATRPRTDSNATAPSSNQLSKRDNKKAREARERTLEASPAPSSNGKGLKKTLTDFRIESLEIPALDWLWKAMPLSHILARMNLKEKKEELQTLREASMGVIGEEAGEPIASTSTQLPSVAEESEKTNMDESKAESLKTAESTFAPTIEADAATQAVSAEMQKSDSRPEKRKHARDEDEPEDESRYGQLNGEAASDEGDHPVGKKVKSEVQQVEDAVAEPADPPAETEPALNAGIMQSEGSAEVEDTGKSTLDGSTQQAQESKDDDVEAQEELPATTDNSVLRDDEVSSEASSSADEVAATFIVSKSPSKPDPPVGDYEASMSRTQLEVDDADSIAGTSIRPDDDAELDEGTRSRRETSQLPDDITLRDVPKKLRENSRLRIYFMSPVELEQKEIRQSLLKPKTPSALSQSQLAIVEAKPEPATTSADLPAGESGADETEAQKKEETDEGNDGQEDEVEATVDDPKPGQDDLDGEPLAAKATEEEDKPEDKALSVEVEGDAAASVPEVKVEEAEPSDELVPSGSKPSEEAKQQEAESTTLPMPSPDRLSIAYAQNTRRLVVDAQVVDEVAIHRADGRIEITVRAIVPEKAQNDSRSFRALNGIYVEKALITGEYSYEEIGFESLVGTWGPDESSKPKEMADGSDLSGDHLTPPLHYLVPSSEVLQNEEANAKRFTIVARLDRANPLTEAKWVRTGTPDEWMLSCIREMGLTTSVARTAQQQHPKGEQGSNNANASTSTSTSPLLSNWRDAKGSAWKGKIRVVDPDAPPTFHHALENWLSSTNSRSGFDEARYRFVNTHFQDIDNVLEVLLRLIRGSAAPDHQQQSSSRDSHRSSSSTNNAGGSGGGVSGGSQTAAFAVQALASGVPYAEQQTPISLASFQLFKMGIEAAIAAGTPKAEIDRKVGEIVRSLPYSLIFRSMDTMFVDFKRHNHKA